MGRRASAHGTSSRSRTRGRRRERSTAGGRHAGGGRADLAPGGTFGEVVGPVPIPAELPVLRDRPAAGFRHVLRRCDVVSFLELLDDWDDLGRGLHGIRLAGGEPDCFGWYEPGLVVVGAWPRSRTILLDEAWVEESRPVLERLEVPIESLGGGRRRLEFDDAAARGFLLLDVLLHELGHHHDRMHTRSQYECSRGEPYALEYAERRTEELWDRYAAAFGI